MVNKENIIDAYKWILDREPESENVIQAWLKRNIGIAELRAYLISSEEFKQKNKLSQINASTKKNVDNEKASKETSNIKSIEYSFDDIHAERLIFLHVPKTGGTTLHDFLKGYFNEDKICPARYNSLSDYNVGDLVGYSFFSGHYNLPNCSLIPGKNNKIITFLREPQARLISAYYFWRSHVVRQGSPVLPVLANENSFCDFLDHPVIKNGSNTFNPYTQLLIGKTPSGEFNDFGYLDGLNEADRVLYDEAIVALDSLEFYGLLEEYDESVRRLSNQLNLNFKGTVEKKMVLSDLVEHSTSSFKPVEKEILTDKHKFYIQKNTYLDTLIYDYAVSKFNSNTK